VTDHTHSEHPATEPLKLEAPRYWRSLEELAESPAARQAAHDEFKPGAMDYVDLPTSNLSRRSFLGLVGATAAVAATVACDRKGKQQVVPYTRRPTEVVPGVANFYASTFPEGRRGYAVLVKTREGRPIHITGNDEHPGLKGKTSPRALADVLRLYDPDRLRGPKAKGKNATWAEVDQALVATLVAAKRDNKAVLLMTGATASPSRKALLAEFKAALPSLEIQAWEPALGEGAQLGSLAAFGSAVEVRPRLEKAKVVLSLGADFLNGDDPEAIAAFMAPRRPEAPVKEMNRLWVIEGPLTLTGTNADHRFPVKPSKLAGIAFALAKELQAKGHALPTGAALPNVSAPAEIPAKDWKALVNDLHHAGREAVVLCGEAMPAEAHVAMHLLNAMLGSQALELRPMDTLATLQDLNGVVKRMAEGHYAAALLWGVNPAHAFPRSEVWKSAFAKVPTRAWIGQMEDESAAQCELLLPEHHWLEAWGDHADGPILTLQQPTVGALYDTRQGEDTLLALLKGLGVSSAADYHAFLQARWQKQVLPTGSLVPFERFFQAALHDGLVKTEGKAPALPTFKGNAVAEAAARTLKSNPQDFELILRPGSQVHDGRYGNSNWLQELPDPVTKATWGNPLSLSVADARRLKLQDGDRVELEVDGVKLTLPVILQPGQAMGTLALALGYGRSTGSVARGVGQNAFPLLAAEGTVNLRQGVKLAKGRGRMELPVTQSHFRLDGRDIVKGWTLAEFQHHVDHPHKPHDTSSLYPEQQFPEHKWGMAIDLSTCIGCSGCVLACQSENNIPTVGPDQIIRGREMHWIRIDRYYEGEEDNPKVLHQPMLCQHCDSAPCENVCPVNATNHSPDGLNQMAYNRCVGTRYCANNCPYKVRRFNFLEFTADKTEPESLVYNPEVTVRPRGVMEKCSFCVQRIQDGRMRAKAEGRPVADGDIQPACAAACPSEAIVFGDLKDPNSKVSKMARTGRSFKVLEELGARPAVSYLADLKNPAGEGGHHAG